MPGLPIPYSVDLETIEDDEAETVRSLREVFVEMATKVAETEGHAFRAVHAKGQGLLRGRLKVLEGLPDTLRQGLFAHPGEYDAIVRLSSPPAEQLPDDVSTPRALAIKVLNVPGEHVEDCDEPGTQDFLMVNGPKFSSKGPQQFLRAAKLLASTTEKAPGAKAVLSAVLRGTEAALEAVGTQSGTIKGLGGEPQHHPLGETYFTQVPFRYGDYVAKFSLAPVSGSLLSLEGGKLHGDGDDLQRDAVNEFFARTIEPVQWELRVQLRTDAEKMPIEDAAVEWPQELSPFVAVAHLTVAPQTAYGDATQKEEDSLTFDPWHALEAHRPLGAVNRARKQVIAASRNFRSSFNRCPMHAPS